MSNIKCFTCGNKMKKIEKTITAYCMESIEDIRKHGIPKEKLVHIEEVTIYECLYCEKDKIPESEQDRIKKILDEKTRSLKDI